MTHSDKNVQVVEMDELLPELVGEMRRVQDAMGDTPAMREMVPGLMLATAYLLMIETDLEVADAQQLARDALTQCDMPPALSDAVADGLQRMDAMMDEIAKAEHATK